MYPDCLLITFSVTLVAFHPFLASISGKPFFQTVPLLRTNRVKRFVQRDYCLPLFQLVNWRKLVEECRQRVVVNNLLLVRCVCV